MKKELLTYLQDRHHIILLLLGVFTLACLLILIFPPYYIYTWVERYHEWLQWSVVVMLVTIIGVLTKEISDLRTHIRQLTAPDKIETTDSPEMYNFYDERGELKLSVKAESLYYIEAADNYVQIHYMNAGKLHGLMIRNTLKNIEWRFRGKDLMRCHRSFIVNFAKVQLLRRQEGDVLLDFGDERLPNIPVSKGYHEKILERFTVNS